MHITLERSTPAILYFSLNERGSRSLFPPCFGFILVSFLTQDISCCLKARIKTSKIKFKNFKFRQTSFIYWGKHFFHQPVMIWSVKHSWKACDSVLKKQHSSQTCALGWLQGEKVKCRIKGPFARRVFRINMSLFTICCFVLLHSKAENIFRSQEQQPTDYDMTH